MISCSHWGLFQIVDGWDAMELPLLEGPGVIAFPRRYRTSVSRTSPP